MTKVSVKRLSILGLVLMGASAVTAAIIPNKPSPKQLDGTLKTNQTSAAGKTCVTNLVEDASCNVTTNSTDGTTGIGGGTSVGITANNTTVNS